VIAGNDLHAITLVLVSAATFTNNLIGRNASDSASLPNGGYGVVIAPPTTTR